MKEDNCPILLSVSLTQFVRYRSRPINDTHIDLRRWNNGPKCVSIKYIVKDNNLEQQYARTMDFLERLNNDYIKEIYITIERQRIDAYCDINNYINSIFSTRRSKMGLEKLHIYRGLLSSRSAVIQQRVNYSASLIL